MRILVAGGAGFIGSHTTNALLRAGDEVRVLDSLEPPVHRDGRSEYLPLEVELLRGDVRDRRAWEHALVGVDAVLHLAAYQDYMPDFSRFFDVNAVGTALLYEVLVERRAAVGRVVVASSQAVYGEGPCACAQASCPAAGEIRHPGARPATRLERAEWDHPCPSCGAPRAPHAADETLANPQNQYALSKHSQELIAMSLGRRYGIPTVAMRYSIVQGPRQSFRNAYSGACRIFCLSHLFGRPLPVYEDGRQLRDYVDVEDVVAANLVALRSDAAPDQVLNVGGERAYTVLELARIVGEAFGDPREAQPGGRYRYGDTRHIVSDTSRLKRLGWTPRRSPRDSVRDYVAWLRELGDDVRDSVDEASRAMAAAGVVRRAR